MPIEKMILELAKKSEEYTSVDYQCPYCKVVIEGGLEGFRSHYFSEDKSQHCSQIDRDLDVVCPICEKREGGSSNYKSHNLMAHLEYRHKMCGPVVYSHDESSYS